MRMSNYSSIFISYRRNDSAHATGRIYDRLVTKFGRERVFKDIDNIPFGVDFAEHLACEVSKCAVVLVIVGKKWVTVTEPDGSRRLDNPDDYVRIEIESALQRGIPVIPVLLDRVNMPQAAQLPNTLKPFARRNAVSVEGDPKFHTDMDRLIKGLDGWMQSVEVAPKSVAQDIIDNTSSPITYDSVPTRRDMHVHGVSINGVRLNMVDVPGGTFLMGSPDTEAGRIKDNESPQHKVKILPFSMGIYPVTQSQWQAVATLPKVKYDLTSNPSHFKGENRPVERVNWHEAMEFCQRLSIMTGLFYRLPSEAEWEYACRAGTTTPFYWGNRLDRDKANFGDNISNTTAVGQYPKNAFGLYDMHGNVHEWCRDHAHKGYRGAPKDGKPWLTDRIIKRIIRGGSWSSDPSFCRSAMRDCNEPYDRSTFIGFRVSCNARSIPEKYLREFLS